MMPAEKKTRYRKERIDGVTSRTMCNDKSEIRKKLSHFEANISEIYKYEIVNLDLQIKYDKVLSKPYTINFIGDEKNKLIEQSKSKFVTRCCLMKTKYNISNKAWQDLKNKGIITVPLCQILACVEQFACFTIEKNLKGFYYNTHQKMTFFLTRLVNLRNIQGTVLYIKLAGDGAQMDRKGNKVFHFGCTLINDRKFCKSILGIFLLGAFRIFKECNFEFTEALREILVALKYFHENGILINEQVYQIEFLGGGDMSYDLHLYGINGANSHYSCMYCTAHKDTFGDLNLIDGEWPINRTHAESKRILESLKLIKKKADRLEAAKGYVVEPVIDFVEFIKIIYDTLHMFIRVGGKLLEHLINDLKVMDGSDSDDLENMPNFKELFRFLESDCKISNPFIFGAKIIPRAMQGPDMEKIFPKMDFVVRPRNETNKRIEFKMTSEFYLPYIPERKKIAKPTVDQLVNETTEQKNSRDSSRYKKVVQIWQEFGGIYKDLKEINIFSKYYLDIYENRLKNWLKLYISVYPAVTPYMHILVCHSRELLALYGNINDYNTQNLEKLNHNQKIAHNRATNRHPSECMTTQMEYRNRQELDAIGIKDTVELKELNSDQKKRRLEIDRLDSFINFPEELNSEEKLRNQFMFSSFKLLSFKPANFKETMLAIKNAIFDREEKIKNFIFKCQQVKTQQMCSEDIPKDQKVKKMMDIHLNNKYKDLFQAVEIEMDGNCLFRSISMSLFNTQKFHKQLRIACMYIIFKYQSYFLEVSKQHESNSNNRDFSDDQFVGILIERLCVLGRFGNMDLIMAALTIIAGRKIFYFKMFDEQVIINEKLDQSALFITNVIGELSFKNCLNLSSIRNLIYNWNDDQSIVLVLHNIHFTSLVPTANEPITIIKSDITNCILAFNDYYLHADLDDPLCSVWDKKTKKKETEGKYKSCYFVYPDDRFTNTNENGTDSNMHIIVDLPINTCQENSISNDRSSQIESKGTDSIVVPNIKEFAHIFTNSSLISNEIITTQQGTTKRVAKRGREFSEFLKELNSSHLDDMPSQTSIWNIDQSETKKMNEEMNLFVGKEVINNEVNKRISLLPEITDKQINDQINKNKNQYDKNMTKKEATQELIRKTLRRIRDDVKEEKWNQYGLYLKQKSDIQL